MDAVPSEVVQILEVAAKSDVLQYADHVDGKPAIELFDAAGVRALVYKGPALAVQTTSTWRGRGSADVDILIDPHTTTTAHDALLRAGLTRRDGPAEPPSRMLKYRDRERPTPARRHDRPALAS